MGLYDRDYTQADFQSNNYAMRPRLVFPRPTQIVKWLLISNFVIFFAGTLLFPRDIIVPGFPQPINLLEKWFSVFPYSLGSAIQIWRLVTYQFLHGSLLHVLFNMLWLYFLGPTLERHWGGKKFLTFYLMCGTAGGFVYLILVGVNFLPACPMVGASGAILGVFTVCAILFPQIAIYLFPFPVAIPIRFAAIAGAILYIFFVMTRSANAGGHAAHLAGMAAGAAYVLSGPWRNKIKVKMTAGQRWQKKMTQQRNLQIELDRILDKVHKSGIHSLSSKEKKILKQATKAEQMRNRF